MDFLAAHGPDLLFYLFAALAVGAAVCVVALRNPMYGAVALLTCFLAVAALFLLQHAEFVAVVQIFVYGGGIMVLFLFVIMLVNLHRLPETRRFLLQSPVGILVVLLLVGVLGTFLYQESFPEAGQNVAAFTTVTTAGGAVLGSPEPSYDEIRDGMGQQPDEEGVGDHDAAPPREDESFGNTQAVAAELYTKYLLPFEIASIFLLVAMIGAVVLGRRG